MGGRQEMWVMVRNDLSIRATENKLALEVCLDMHLCKNE